MYDVVIDFPKFKVGVKTHDERVVEIKYLPASVETVPAKNPLAARAARQLEQYRENPDARFDLPLLIEGSELQ